MNDYKYTAFGLRIDSEFPIPQLPVGNGEKADVIIRKAVLPTVREEGILVEEGTVSFRVPGLASFRICEGVTIEADPETGYQETQLGVYLMGSCMGAILHQRGILPLHGSTVTDGSRAVLITGDSGAGKSTLAAEFLKNGWKLVTDDVAAVENIDSVPTVRSSYPSQKLWEDTLKCYPKGEGKVHSLYFREEREKYGVSVSDAFFGGSCPLTLIVLLIPADSPCCIQTVEVMPRIDQLIRNTYRLYMIPPKQRQRHFQSCVTLAGKVPMALLLRQKDTQCANILYEMILKLLGA